MRGSGSPKFELYDRLAIPATKSCATLWGAETSAIFSTTALVPLDIDHEVAQHDRHLDA
jgi:hypothetical protein